MAAADAKLKLERLVQASDFPLWKFRVAILFKFLGIYDVKTADIVRYTKKRRERKKAAVKKG